MTEAPIVHQMSKVECRVCHKPRWDDGLKCPQCASYQNPEAGRPVRITGFSAWEISHK